jgi:hypothetical protein
MKTQIWQDPTPIPTTVPQVIRETERQRIESEEAAVTPSECPKCGCQMFDPFTGKRQIHFTNECDAC